MIPLIDFDKILYKAFLLELVGFVDLHLF